MHPSGLILSRHGSLNNYIYAFLSWLTNIGQLVMIQIATEEETQRHGVQEWWMFIPSDPDGLQLPWAPDILAMGEDGRKCNPARFGRTCHSPTLNEELRCYSVGTRMLIAIEMASLHMDAYHFLTSIGWTFACINLHRFIPTATRILPSMDGTTLLLGPSFLPSSSDCKFTCDKVSSLCRNQTGVLSQHITQNHGSKRRATTKAEIHWEAKFNSFMIFSVHVFF